MADEGDKQAWGDEISDERKVELEQRLQAWEQETDNGQRKGPFDSIKLTGADVFWLAARTLAHNPAIKTSTNEQEWLRSSPAVSLLSQGIDLSALHLDGADLANTQLDRAFLARASLTHAILRGAVINGAHLEGADLRKADLTDSVLSDAYMERTDLAEALLVNADLQGTHLNEAFLREADLTGSDLTGAHLSRAYLVRVRLQGTILRNADLADAVLDYAQLERADLTGANLRGARLSRAHLEQARLGAADLRNAILVDAHLEANDIGEVELGPLGVVRTNLGGARLQGVHLERAFLQEVDLSEADLRNVHLEGAVLYGTNLAGADLRQVHLEGADLREARMNAGTRLTGTVLDDHTLLADVVWNSVPLTGMNWMTEHKIAFVSWQHMRILGDEKFAATSKTRKERVAARQAAVRAYNGLAVAMRAQGLNDYADRFAYRAQVLQRGVHLQRIQLLRWLFSWLLCILAGYGYRTVRTLFWYLAVIFGFAFLYMHFGHINGQPFQFDEALVFSVTSFHGRGFFPGTLDLKDLVTKLAASEAVFGLFIEVSFIATFTQRYFGK